jgi:ABC-type nitrate/sulfonate/bicarbonate transport system substrate-binding protein
VDGTGAATGVDVEIRIGGAAIGFQTVTSQLHQDPDILVGFVNSGESILNADELPTVAVLAPLEKNPQILMWNPEEFPGVETVEEMPEDTLVVGYGPATYLSWMVTAGLITEDQIDGSYDASPSRFVAENGAYLQQGFATSEPYIYEFEVEEWGRPVAYQLVHDMGYELYSQALGVTPETLAAERDCLAAFVPIYQAAQIAYVTDPAATNAVILDMVDTIDNGWVYSEGVTAFSVQAQLDLGVVGNGPDDTLGNFDLERVQGVIDALRPVSEGQGTPLRDDLAPEDVVTNEFVDPSLGLP